MRILNSQVNKPEDRVAKSIEKHGQVTAEAVKNLQDVVDSYKPEIEEISTTVKSMGDALHRLEQIDNSIDTGQITNPITEQIDTLRNTINNYREAVNNLEVKPEVKVDIPPPDLSIIDESFTELNKDIQELFRELDLMERPEMKEYFKKILDLLEKINKKTWSFIGGGGGTNILQGYEINSGNLVNITAVESADTPGVYGVLALNADGSAIGSGGGGVVETFKRITSDGGIRVTSSGDTRVYST